MGQWGTLITTELASVKTIALSIFVALGVIRIIINGISYKGGTDDEKLDAKKSIRNNVLWFLLIPFCIWLALYLYNKGSAIS